jgi:hypothetical protein
MFNCVLCRGQHTINIYFIFFIFVLDCNELYIFFHDWYWYTYLLSIEFIPRIMKYLLWPSISLSTFYDLSEIHSFNIFDKHQMSVGTNVMELWPKLIHAIKSEVARGILRSLALYFWLFRWRLSALYNFGLWATTWLAHPLVQHWHWKAVAWKANLGRSLYIQQ